MIDCVFCKISEGEIPSEKIYENDSFFSVFDVVPQVEGHALVVSKKHFENILDLPNIFGSELLDCIKNTSIKLMEDFKCEGFNIVQNNFKCAGQVINHIHFHILPRKKGDEKELGLRKKKF